MRTSGAGFGCGTATVALLGERTGFVTWGSWLKLPSQKDAPATNKAAAVAQPTRSSAPRFTGAVFFGAASSVSQGRRSRPPAVRLSLISTHLLGRSDAHKAQTATDDLRDSKRQFQPRPRKL